MKDNSSIMSTRQNLGSGSLAGSPCQRISFYIDGFNLYHALKNIKRVHENNTILNPIPNYNSIT
jgi:hypothetical protein